MTRGFIPIRAAVKKDESTRLKAIGTPIRHIPKKDPNKTTIR
jgi:hypothetical protein